jgi:hypothetical protein
MPLPPERGGPSAGRGGGCVIRLISAIRHRSQLDRRPVAQLSLAARGWGFDPLGPNPTPRD